MRAKHITSLKSHLENARMVERIISLPFNDQIEVVEKLPYDDAKVFRDGYIIPTELFASILEVRARRLKEKGFDYNPVILSDYTRYVFVKHLNTLAQSNETKRFDAIMQNALGLHATAFSFFVSPGKVECVFIDPSIDTRNTDAISSWRRYADEAGVVFNAYGFQEDEKDAVLQKDMYSCLPYAEVLLHKMHRMSLQELKEATSTNKFTHLPAYLMKYTQSIFLLEQYWYSNPNTQFGLGKKYSEAEFKRQYCRHIAHSTGSYLYGTEQFESKFENRALDFLRTKRITKAIAFLESLSEEEVSGIVRSRVNS